VIRGSWKSRLSIGTKMSFERCRMSKVTYVVSAFDRPWHLRCCLASLQVQTDPDFMVIVADNGNDVTQAEHFRVVQSFDSRFVHLDSRHYDISPGWDCYWSADWVVEHYVSSPWVCLPSDDTYYVPVFQETLLKYAEERDLQLVYCEMLYDRRGSADGRYHLCNVAASPGRIDKVGFMVKREVWQPHPQKPLVPGPTMCDGWFIEQVVNSGIRHGKVDEPLVVHN
jgi:hypothetical protein